MKISQPMIGRTRLISGLILFCFIATHLLNHALGLIGLDAMESGRALFLSVWRNPIGSIILYGAIIVHIGLAFWALYRRRNWQRITRNEILQLLLGMAIPPLAAIHIIANRGQHEVFGLNDTYAHVLLVLWQFSPLESIKQSILVLVAWAHGCLGMHYWLRLKPKYERWQIWLYTGALLLPAAALAGFVSGAREAVLLFQDPIWRQRFIANSNDPGQAGVEWSYFWAETTYNVMTGLLLGLIALIFLRRLWERRRGIVTITYPGQRRVRIIPGLTVLEASHRSGVPHASVCGGRGRCSTCRVHITAGAEHLDPPSVEELRVLSRVGAPSQIRLACQLRPTCDLNVIPLLPASATPQDSFGKPTYSSGTEKEICIIFTDLRGFTQFAEKKLPFDVVFIINQYFRLMGQAVERAGGQLDKFIGDGVMALFGLHTDSAQGCRDALHAAHAMAMAIENLNESLKADLAEPLRIGIGIHVGPVIVGEMGYAQVQSITAIGDAVNTASRLESMTKEFGMQLVVSRRVARRANINLDRFPTQNIDIRGRSAPMPIYLIKSALDLSEVLDERISS